MRLLIILILLLSCLVLSSCRTCTTYDYNFPSSGRFQKSYEFIEKFITNPVISRIIKSDTSICSYSLIEKLKKDIYHRHYKYMIENHVQCSAKFKKEEFYHEPRFGNDFLTVYFEGHENFNIEFHFIKEDGIWKFDKLLFGHPIM